MAPFAPHIPVKMPKNNGKEVVCGLGAAHMRKMHHSQI
jgi:hypothetical protein